MERISSARIHAIPKGNFKRPDAETVFGFVEQTMAKQRTRRTFLAENPGASIHIDPHPLRDILPGSAFVCYTGSSVANDRAIRGSDIDGGIVITPEKVSAEKQRDYIFALRKQGFRVYTQAHFETIEQSGVLVDSPDLQQDIAFKVITFETFDEFSQRRESGASIIHAKCFIIYADEDSVSSGN